MNVEGDNIEHRTANSTAGDLVKHIQGQLEHWEDTKVGFIRFGIDEETIEQIRLGKVRELEFYAAFPPETSRRDILGLPSFDSEEEALDSRLMEGLHSEQIERISQWPTQGN